MNGTTPKDSFGTRAPLALAGGARADYFRLGALADAGLADLEEIPFSVRILLEAILRNEDGRAVTREHVVALAGYDAGAPPPVELPFKPARVLLQDFTGVPAVVDLAAMRSAMARLGGDPERINPLIPVDLVIDHSVQVDAFGSTGALLRNTTLEMERNRERYEFLRWGQSAFRNFRVVPPRSGICHQVNLEYLAKVVRTRADALGTVAFPDSLVGTDSHTTMVNGLGVLGWGVGGIEAEAGMLGQPLYMLAPEVVGVRLAGSLTAGATATDLVLRVTELLRQRGVVGKFVEFFGPGLSTMSVPDRATIANMAPEYGATVGFFPVDAQTLAYLRGTGRDEALVDLVERYTKAQGLFRTDETPDPRYTDTLSLDLGAVTTSLAGPSRPQDRVELGAMRQRFREALRKPALEGGWGLDGAARATAVDVAMEDGSTATLRQGALVIAAITSCTNTSNPMVMLGAGVLAKKAFEAGLTRKPWVKTSLAPGSKVVTDYLTESGLLPYLEALGFHVVGYGCTTCIGNSGPLPEAIDRAIAESGLVAAAVLSGNRNFEGRIHARVRAAYLASPPLVVAYALAGTVDIDLEREPLGRSAAGEDVYLRDVWPTGEEIRVHLGAALAPEVFLRKYNGIERSNEEWNAIPVTGGAVYAWSEASTYIQEPPFFIDMDRAPAPIRPVEGARALTLLGDSITTDHISPAGAIPSDGPAGRYLIERGVSPRDFNSFGSRRGNDRVMIRGTFANIRLKNRLAPGTEGGWTTHQPSGELLSIHEASLRYARSKTPTIVIGGRDYGMGSSRDWAAKGTFLLGVRAVIAASFERIHRSNLIGMGVLPLQLREGESAASLGLTGRETYTVHVDDTLRPGQTVAIDATDPDTGQTRRFETLCRIDSPIEVDYYRNGGILHTVLRELAGR